jgi:hypothetical protein
MVVGVHSLVVGVHSQPLFAKCRGCSVVGQCRYIKVSVANRLCQICEDYVTEGTEDGDHEGVVLMMAGHLPWAWKGDGKGKDGKGDGKGKAWHESDKAEGGGKGGGIDRSRSRSPRRHEAITEWHWA